MIGRKARREPDADSPLWRLPFSREYGGRISVQPQWLEKGLIAVAVLTSLIGVVVLIVGLLQVLFALIPSLRSYSGVQSTGTVVAVGFGVAGIGVLIGALGFVESMIATSGLFVTRDGVIVLNVLARHVLSRSEIRTVETSRNFVGMPCLKFEIQDGRTVHAHYAGGQLTLRDYWGPFLGYSQEIENETQRLAAGLRNQLTS